MDDYETRKRELEIELMTVQIDKGRIDIEKIRLDISKAQQELRWEPWKALAAIVIGVAAMSTAIVGLAHWLAPTMQ